MKGHPVSGVQKSNTLAEFALRTDVDYLLIAKPVASKPLGNPPQLCEMNSFILPAVGSSH